MRINKTTSKNNVHYSIIRDIQKNGKRTTCIYENIGNMDQLKLRAGDEEPLVWLNNYVNELNRKYKENSLPVIIHKNPNKIIEKNIQNIFNIGYFFLQDIYYKLKLDDICNKISNNYQFKFNFNDILSKLIFSRIIFPASKLKTLELSKKFFEQPNFEYQHIERALPILNEENDFIHCGITLPILIKPELRNETRILCNQNRAMDAIEAEKYNQSHFGWKMRDALEKAQMSLMLQSQRWW